MTKLVVINYKCNYTLKEINNLISFYDKLNLSKNYIMLPSSIYLPYFLNKTYSVGIQNISSCKKGAYTGQVAAFQVASLPIDYVLLGHMETRKYLHDDNINKKIKRCLENNLKVILCINSINDLDILSENANIDNIVIAFEPDNAIGQNESISVNEIKKNIALIKNILYNRYGKSAKVIYGGSINEKNIHVIASIDILDGYLISTSALMRSKFLKIREVIEKL